MKFYIAIGLALTVIPSLASEAQRLRHVRSCGCVLDTVAAMEQSEKVKTIRSITDYTDHIAPLLPRLRRLKANSHILDFGAGEMLAMAEYLGLADQSGRSQDHLRERLGLNAPRANVTTFSYKMKDGGQAYRQAAKGKLRTLTGYFAEDDAVTPEVLMGEFGPIDLVIDHWGVIAYTADPTVVLRKLMPALAKNAVLITRTGPREYDWRSGFGNLKQKSSLYRSLVDGTPFPDWLKEIPGWDIVDDEKIFDVQIPDPNASAIPQIWFKGMDPNNLEPMPGGRLFERDRP